MKNLSKWYVGTAIISIIFFSFLVLNIEKVPAQSYGQAQEQETDGQTLMTAFGATQGDLSGTNINFWTEIKDKKYSQEEMKKIALNFIKELDMEDESTLYVDQDTDYEKVMVTAQRDDQMLLTVIMESYQPKEQPVENYFVVDVSLGNEYKDIPKYETIMKEYFQSLGYDYDYAMTIIGTFPEKMNINTMRDTIGNSFAAIEGQVLEGIEETEYGEMVSLSGYSPQIKNSLQLSGRKMNMNAAMRYNEYDQKTYFWIGSPLIATEY